MNYNNPELDNELLDSFISECFDMLDEVEPNMISASCLDQDLANRIFRPVHSIKGAAASLGLNNIASVSHAAEALLTILRSGYCSFSHEEGLEYLSFFLSYFDFLRMIFDQLKALKSDESFSPHADSLVRTADSLTRVLEESVDVGKSSDTKKKSINIVLDGPRDASISGNEEAVGRDVEQKTESVGEIEVAGNSENGENNEGLPDLEISVEMLDAFRVESLESMDHIEEIMLAMIRHQEEIEPLKEAFRLVHSFKGNCGLFAFKQMGEIGHKIEEVFEKIIERQIPPRADIFERIVHIIDIIREKVTSLEMGDKGDIEGFETYVGLIEEVIFAQLQKKNKAAEKNVGPSNIKDMAKAGTKRQDIRVDLTKLDMLNALVGELVTAKTILFENLRRLNLEDEQLEKSSRFLDRVSNDLHDMAMNIRMVPVAVLFKKMIRICHDISVKSGKKVNLRFIGDETEIDKTLIEKLNDPLVHMIRNAVDHGIESPQMRIASGKQPEGDIVLSARNEAGEVWIMLKDDGAGLNRDKILAKAKKLEMVRDDGAHLSDQEIFSFIFAPGFSTAEKVTDISGRGVGMDVVAQNIKDVKGRIDIVSRPGEGTTFIIKIPLTLAIIKGMLVRAGDIRYTIPIDTIQETLKVKAEDLCHPIDQQELIKVRNHMIPILRLSLVHGTKKDIDQIEDGIVVIVEVKGQRVGLFVDKLEGQHDTVVRPMPNYLRNVTGVSGCSILGNGETSLILDTRGLLELAQNKESRVVQ